MLKFLVLLAIAGPSICQPVNNTLLPANYTILPDYMVADFDLESNDGLSGALSELGVGWFARQIAKTLYPAQKIRQNKETGEIFIDTETPFKSMHTQFFLDVPWEEYTLDMRTTTTVTSLDGNKLIKEQVPIATGYHTTRELRDFKDDDGDGVYESVILTITIMDKTPEDTIVRLYCQLKTKDQSQHRYGCSPHTE